MVLASGCGSKTLVRIGGGNLKSVVVFAVLGIAAFATLKGITGVARVATVDRVAFDLAGAQDLPSLAARAFGVAKPWAAHVLGVLLGGGLVVWALARREGRSRDVLLGGVGIGAVIAAMWWVSGRLGYVAEDPNTLQEAFIGTNSQRMESLSFVAPIAYSIDWLIFFSDKSKVLTIGIVSIAGRHRRLGAGGAGHAHLPLGRFCQRRRHRQPPRRRGADGRRRRHRDGLHGGAGLVGLVHARARQLHRFGRHRLRRGARVALPGVAPGAHGLNADLERRFGGLRRLYGDEGYARLRAARVAVVGVGGVGSWAAEALARCGVAALTLIDMDHVAESNINRQVQALGATLGKAKVQALAERIADIHPGCDVHGVEEFAAADNWPALLPHAVDAVIDACDQVRAKQALAAWALQERRPRLRLRRRRRRQAVAAAGAGR